MIRTHSVWLGRPLATLLLVIAALPAVAPAGATSGGAYFYDAAGRQELTVATAEWVVGLTPEAARAGTRPAFLPPPVTPDGLPDEAVQLEARLARRGLHVVRDADGAALRALPGVAWALPLLYHGGHPAPIYPSSQIVAAFQDGVTAETVRAVAERMGCDARPLERGRNRWILTARDVRAADPLTVANSLHEDRALTVYAHPDFFLPKVTCSPPVIEDPLYITHQWHLDGDVLKGAAAGSDINVEGAWDTANAPNEQGQPAVRVAVLDECVEKWHEDLFPNWATGRDYDNEPPDDDPSPDGGQRHGTSCAGVAVAAGNTWGVRGAAPNCGLIGVKFFGATLAQMADSYYFCMDPNNDGDHSDGAAVMSNSWGFADGTLLPTDVVTAINTAAVNGRNGLGSLILFAAANNDHTVDGVSALAQLATTMAVGGTNSNAEHTEFSDVGPELAIGTPTNDRGDDGVRFPWIDITTVDNMGTSGYNGLPNLNYTNAFGGTSSATPLAAGILGLIISQDPNMTAGQARALLQHTAVRLDEPFGRFDGITGHSHRYGFGKADAAAAVTAAHAGIRWPDRIRNLTANAAGANVNLVWDTPSSDYAGSVLVRSSVPFAWMPTDGATYTLGQEVVPGVEVIYTGSTGNYLDTDAASGGFFYGVYPRSSVNRYGFGARAHIFRDAIALFSDNCEIPDPGWTHGGAGDEWQRGPSTAWPALFSQSITGSGPLPGQDGLRAIGGHNAWGTDLSAPYNAYADQWLATPLVNLVGVTAPVFLEYWDWCLLETYYDSCAVEVVDADDNLLGVVDGDTGGDYDWTRRVYDLTPFAGQAFKVRFRLTSDGVIQRDGWFLDEIKIVVAANVPLPPVANEVYKETTANTPVGVLLSGRDPNPGTTLDFIVTTLPVHGTLSDPQGGTITMVPYTLVSHGAVVTYTPAPGYEGPDGFAYRASDGTLQSNDAEVRLSVGTPVVAYSFNLNTNPGWLTEGLWQYGPPQGQGGDPSAAYSGLNIYGYNLAGTYTNNMPPTRLTTLPLNCTGLSRVTLKFARWLGVEQASWDSANVEATSDGVNWQTVWSHTGATLTETAWSIQTYNISLIADGQPFVQVRWTLGPTDGGDVYAGWNIDDVQILAIGTPPANQPPLARALALSVARDETLPLTLLGSDSNLDPLAYTIVTLPSHGTLVEPGVGPIATVPHTLAGGASNVEYTPAPGYAGTDRFDYQVDDGALPSNVAPVDIEVLGPAPFPLTETFDAGPPLAEYWQVHSTGTGRIVVSSNYEPQGSYHVTMDSSYEGNYSLNELTLVADLAGHAYVRLQYDWKSFSDDSHPLPATWTGSAEGDGVAISQDGLTWHKIADLLGAAATYQTVLIDLDQVVAAAGLAYTSTFRIRFQQYDNNPIDGDGLAIDNVRLIQGTTDPLITTSALPPGFVGQPYGPIVLEVAGGDAPLTWALLDVYGEENLGTSLFAAAGLPQGWMGGNVVFDTALPFAFPFYGELQTTAKVATDGWINFGPYVGATYTNSAALLSNNKRIAPLWDNLRTDQPGNDIFMDTSVPGEVTFRWVAVTHTGLFPCNFAATLYADGRIRFHYGAGNTGLTPTVGVSKGDQVNYTLAEYDNAASLTNANSIELLQSLLPPGVGLLPNGTLSGTPTALGHYKPIFHVLDSHLPQQRSDAKMIPLAVVPDVYGDWDVDGDCDFSDFEAFVECLDQPQPSGQCLGVFDENGSGTVDLADFELFQQSFTGP